MEEKKAKLKDFKSRPKTNRQIVNKIIEESGALEKDSLVNERQADFCIRYIESGNGTESYVGAFGLENRSSAGSSANRLLRKPEIKQYINNLLNSYSEDIDVQKGEIMREVKRIAFGSEFDASAATKLAALKMLGQSKGMYGDKVEITTKEIKVTLEDILGGDDRD